MTLVLMDRAGLDDLELLAKENFLCIPNKNIPEMIWPSKPFRPSQMRQKIFVVPVKDVYHVNMTFPMEDMQAYYSAAPLGYLGQLLGYKGPNGLFSYLRMLGLAHHLAVGARHLARGFSFFVVTAQLTEFGERHVDEVVKHVFQYINLIRGE